ncbi:hypothetical protein RhiirA4_484321 [Rhizophagus irregularis]|uniref:F-box domain-containing protein n=1 Tax=Rhizophagus irregularis TaxID=588596 RepID=A0A2I1HNQ8_9GLOM|nr:hypothetical protein RhiirA4_484321 [Rhizophagus irregularis]
MTLPYLTDDCIYSILQYLQNDHSTLFKCLLVNRFWCRSTIPLLYANPFAAITKKNYSITLTLIFCFDKAEILQLKKQLGLRKINGINFYKKHNPLFEYPKYLENYNSNIINSVIYGWFAKYCSKDLLNNQKIYNDIIPIFHQSILRQSRNIKQLDIWLNLFYGESFKNFNVQNFTSNLTKLNSLSLNCYLRDSVYKEIEQEFLKNIANNCTNFRKLIIKFPRTKNSPFQNRYIYCDYLTTITFTLKICTIIQVQNNLKMFKLDGNCSLLVDNILLSLEFQKHSLVHVEFIDTDFSNVNLKRLNNLYNLEYLKFMTCEGILLNQCEGLNFSSFKLKELSFIHNYWDVNVMPLMIKYLGASLQRLFVENPTISLIENISMYCPNLIFLKISIHSHIDLSVIQLFKNLRTRILSIIISKNIDKFFINLANSIPINIREISICSHHTDKFKEFLENCHNSFEMINLNQIIKLKLLKNVLNYIEKSNNSLKVLGMKLDKELNDEELKLLNRIKAKGVEIVEFIKVFHCKSSTDDK